MSPQIDAQPKSNQTVTVSVIHQHCVIEPPQPELASHFHTKRHKPYTNGPYAGQVVCAPFPLVWEQEDSTGSPISICYAGLAPLVVQQLKRNGVQVQFKNKNRSSLKGARYLSYDLFEESDEAVLDFMQQHERGIILHAPKLVNVGRILTQIAYAFPNKSILVAVTRKTDAWKLRNQIAKQLHSRVVTVATSGTNLERSSQVIIGTYTQLAQGFIGIERRDLLFSLNPEEMLTHEHGKDTIKAAHKARFYGFLPRKKKIVTYFKDQLLALFDTNRISIPVPGKVERPVQVLFNLFYHHGSKDQQPEDAWQLKRHGIWEHSIRNRLIASLARGLANHGRDLLKSKFPAIAKQVRFNKKARIGILVDNVDHAASLRKRLKNWPIVAALHIACDDFPAATQAMIAQGAQEDVVYCKNVIVTKAGLSRAGRLDFVIRADGGIDAPNFNLNVSGTGISGRPRQLTIIDFNDRHHPTLKKNSKQRRQAYVDKGWQFPLECLTELDRFMSSRPKVRLS